MSCMASGTRRSLGSLQLSRPTTTTTVARRGQLSVCVAGDRANYFHQERALGSLSSIPAITSRPWQAYPQLQQRNQQQQQQRYPSPAGAIATLSTLSRTRGQDRDRRSSSSESSPAWSSGASGMLFLTVTLLSSSDSSRPAEAAWWPFSGWGWLAGQSGSPFDGVVPERARKQRAKAEVKMRKYLERMHGPIQEQIAAYHAGKITRDELDEQMASFNDEVELSTHRIIYGGINPPDARRKYEAEYGNCRYTPKAIETIKELSPLVEINAGTGHWQRALSSAGVTVVAFDRWAANKDVPPSMSPVGDVLPGDERSIRQHRDKTLLLVYPPPGETASRCLREYQGDVFVYVGEGRGGANANDGFFDTLDAEWEATKILKLKPFAQCFERLFVMRRKPQPDPSALSEESRSESEGGEDETAVPPKGNKRATAV